MCIRDGRTKHQNFVLKQYSFKKKNFQGRLEIWLVLLPEYEFDVLIVIFSAMVPPISSLKKRISSCPLAQVRRMRVAEEIISCKVDLEPLLVNLKQYLLEKSILADYLKYRKKIRRACNSFVFFRFEIL